MKTANDNFRWGIYHMSNDYNFKNDLRKTIYNFIFYNPGLHFGKISRKLGIPKTTLYHHLNILEKQGLIDKQVEGRYHRYYASKDLSTLDKKIINAFRQETSRNIILYLLVNVGATQTELSKNLERHPTTIEFYLKKLEDMNIIKRLYSENKKILIPRVKKSKIIEYTPVSNDVIYKLVDSVKTYDSVVSHKSSFNDEAIIAILNILREAQLNKFNEKVPKKTTKSDSDVDNFLKSIFKIFPIPWCA